MDWLVLFDETTRWIYGGCDDPTSGSSELWQVTAGLHFPSFSDEGIQVLFEYLDTHVQPPLECPADVNADQQVDVSDLLFVISDWGSSESAADINNDGIVDVTDLLAVISSWGSCE